MFALFFFFRFLFLSLSRFSCPLHWLVRIYVCVCWYFFSCRFNPGVSLSILAYMCLQWTIMGRVSIKLQWKYPFYIGHETECRIPRAVSSIFRHHRRHNHRLYAAVARASVNQSGKRISGRTSADRWNVSWRYCESCGACVSKYAHLFTALSKRV